MRIKNDSVQVNVETTANVSETVNIEPAPTSPQEAEARAKARADEYLKNVIDPITQLGVEDGYWRPKPGPAIVRRLMKLKLSDSELTDLLKTHEGRSKFGYCYLEKVGYHTSKSIIEEDLK